MRLNIIAAVAFGLSCFTSCSDTQHAPIATRAADDSSVQNQPEPHDLAASGSASGAHTEHAHVPSQPDYTHAEGRDRAHQDVSDVTNRERTHGGEYAQENRRPAHHDQSGRGFPHAEHAHSSEVHDTDVGRRAPASPAAHGNTSEVDDSGANSKKIAIGDKVPDFEVTIAGKTWKLSELQKNATMTGDGTLVLTFWCSFCHSCRHVEHALEALAKQYHGTVGVLALDASAGETTEGVAEFAKQRELTLPIALDGSGDIFGTRVTTTTVVIDKTGVLRYRGQFGDEEHAFAHDALRAVLAGEDVPVQETRQKG